MKRDALRLSQYSSIETSRDSNGRYFIAYSSGASVFIRGERELRRFLKVPKGLPMRESLDSWLASLADQDAKRTSNLTEVRSSLSAELLATGFGPEVHAITEAEAIDHDPTANTRMIT